MDKAQDKQRKVLGKGLSALLPAKTAPAPPRPEPSTPAPPPAAPPAVRNGVTTVPTGQISANPLQPRHVFDPVKLAELADSIKANGIIQPLIVRHKGDGYELVAGERRLRAARLAGLDEVPVIVQDYADDQLLELALVENIQREDLNAIETAQALERLGRELNLSHEEIGKRTGKDRTTVTNFLRLLKLPQPIQVLLAENRLSMGHARAILSVAVPESQVMLAHKAAEDGYSVRYLEKLIQQVAADASSKRAEPGVQKQEKPLDPNVVAAVRDLESTLGTRVRIIEKSAQRGKIEIEYYSQDDLNRIYELLTGNGQKNG